MHDTLILLLPSPGGPATITGWWRTDGSGVTDSGDGGEWREQGATAARTIALVAAGDAPVHWLVLPGLTAPQAAAAARLAVRDLVLGDPAVQHLAAGTADAADRVPCAVVPQASMTHWQAMLQAEGLTVDALVPVAALVPPPRDAGALRADMPGGAVMAVAGLSAAADPDIDALRTAGLALADMRAPDMAARLAQLATAVPLDLFSGDFAPRRNAQLAPATRRWLLRLTAALALLTLAVPLAQQWQWSRAISAADSRALAAAATVKIAASDAAAAEAELDRRLAARGGGPLALSAPLGGLYRALKAEPSVAVRSLTHIADGTATVTLAAPRVEDVNDVLKQLQVGGFTVTAQPMSGSDGMQMAVITVRAVP